MRICVALPLFMILLLRAFQARDTGLGRPPCGPKMPIHLACSLADLGGDHNPANASHLVPQSRERITASRSCSRLRCTGLRCSSEAPNICGAAPDCSKREVFSNLPFGPEIVGLKCLALRRLGLRRRCFCLENVDLCLRFTDHGLTSVFCLLQLSLYL
jgi:hypothetical protein